MHVRTVLVVPLLCCVAACEANRSATEGRDDDPAEAAGDADVRGRGGQRDQADAGGVDAGSTFTCHLPQGSVALAQGTSASGIALDELNVYWASPGGTISRVPKQGGQTVTISSSEATPSGIATDGINVYWTNGSASAGAVRKFAAGASAAIDLVPNQPSASAIHVSGNHVYWSAANGLLMRADLDGHNPTQLANLSQSVLKIEVQGAYLYAMTKYKLARVPVTGGTPLEFGTDYEWGMAVDGSGLYSSGGNTVTRFDLLGTPTPVTIGDGRGSLAVDQGSLYWSHCFGGSVWKLPKSGGVATEIGKGAAAFGPIAVDDSSVYWMGRDGSLMRACK